MKITGDDVREHIDELEGIIEAEGLYSVGKSSRLPPWGFVLDHKVFTLGEEAYDDFMRQAGCSSQN